MKIGYKIAIFVAIFIIIWLYFLFTTFGFINISDPVITSPINNQINTPFDRESLGNNRENHNVISNQNLRAKNPSLIVNNLPQISRKPAFIEEVYDPPPLSEIEKNITVYLHTIHKRFTELAGPSVDPMEVVENYYEITKNTLLLWDDYNKNRMPKQRNDDSIYVSLGTYRDPFCPMTLKSLYAQAKHPERLFVGLLQQNCFEKTCKTGK